MEENVYEGETERREEEIGEERGTLEEAEDAVAAERERLRSAETDNAALTAELDRLRREVQAAEDELAALRAGRTRSVAELASLEFRLEGVNAEIDALGRTSADATGADVAASLARRADLEAELDSILEALTE